jgi:cytosine/adenosine deaminase-related metal-dependent hydrolase
LKNGWVIDGTGGPPSRADVALLDTMIADLGRLDGAEAARVLDVAGRSVVPGLIDAHIHGDAMLLLADPIHLPALRQGCDLHHRPGRQLVRACLTRDEGLHAALHRRVQRQPVVR